MTLPDSFSWTCGWYVRADGKDCCKIGNDTYGQDFSFEYEDERETNKDSPTRGLKNIKVSITQFRMHRHAQHSRRRPACRLYRQSITS